MFWEEIAQKKSRNILRIILLGKRWCLSKNLRRLAGFRRRIRIKIGEVNRLSLV